MKRCPISPDVLHVGGVHSSCIRIVLGLDSLSLVLFRYPFVLESTY